MHNNDLTELMSLDILYINPNPTQAQSAGDLALSEVVTDYKLLLIDYKYKDDADVIESRLLPATVGLKSRIEANYGILNSRDFEIYANKITIDDGKSITTYGGTSTTYNDVCVIVAIYGIK